MAACDLAKLEWRDPTTLNAHPGNWKDHPPEQRAALLASITRHGWLKTILYNDYTGRVLNGEARLLVALEQGLPLVPVWAISATEDEERAILLEFDQTGYLREVDHLALISLIAAVAESDSPLPTVFSPEFVADLKAEVEKGLGLAGANEPESGGGTPAVRHLSLTFSPAEHCEYQAALATLEERWKTEAAIAVLLRACLLAQEAAG